MPNLTNISLDPLFGECPDTSSAASPKTDADQIAALNIRREASGSDTWHELTADCRSSSDRLAKVRSYLEYALYCLEEGGAESLLDIFGHSIRKSFGRLAVETAAAEVEMPYLLVNFLLGVALVELASETVLSPVRYVRFVDDVPFLTEEGRDLLFGTQALRQAFEKIDALARVRDEEGRWVLPSAQIASSSDDEAGPIDCAVIDSQTLGALSGSPVTACLDGPADHRQQNLSSDPAIVLLSDEDVISSLLEAFEQSPLAPSAKPQVSRSTVRIMLHELGLVESATIAALRAALAAAGPSFHRDVVRRSDLYGLTRNAGRIFNNPTTLPAVCMRMAKAARQTPGSFWTKLDATQRKEREQRWRAWLAFLAQVTLAKGPLPQVPW